MKADRNHEDVRRTRRGNISAICYNGAGAALIELDPSTGSTIKGDKVYHCPWCNAFVTVSEDK